MEKNTYNAIVQGEPCDSVAPVAELKESLEDKQNQANAGAFIDNATSENMEKSHDHQESDNESAYADEEDKASHISISVEEAMRKIMNFTAEANGSDENDIDVKNEKNAEGSSFGNSENAQFSATSDNDISPVSENDNDGASVSDDMHEQITSTDDAKEEKSIDDEMQDSDIADYDDDDGYILEDEFSNIPESFFDEDIDDGDDGSSLSSLLYDDDDAEAASDFEDSDNVSFTHLKQEMQRIKNDAMELRTIVTPDNTESKEIVPEETVAEEDIDVVEEASNEAIEDVEIEPEEIPEKKKISQERRIYTRDIEKEPEIETEEVVKEHIITIDRSRIREKSVPEGRPIDFIFEAVEKIAFSALLVMILLSFVLRFSDVSGESMYPTFNDGDKLVISKLLYTPKRGDVVVFDDRSNDGYEDGAIIKRIIALEGDTVKIEDRIIYVKEYGSDDFTIVNYVEDMEIPNRDMKPVVVPEGEMFVMGDNVNNSKDSREVGTIKTQSIMGKVILRYCVKDNNDSEETQKLINGWRIVFDTKF